MPFTRWFVLAALVVVVALSVAIRTNGAEHRVAIATSLAPASLPAPELEPVITTTELPPPTTTTEAPPPPNQMVASPNFSSTSAPAVTAPTSNTADDPCANPVVPESVVRRESGCTWDAYNPTGCSGRGCLGFFQLDEGHFSAVSPWNPSVSGVCADLAGSKWEPASQTECASRLGPGAWG